MRRADDDRVLRDDGRRVRAERVGLEVPRDLELAEVVLVDLVERRVMRVRQIGPVGRPLAIRWTLLAAKRDGGGTERDDGERETGDPGKLHGWALVNEGAMIAQGRG